MEGLMSGRSVPCGPSLAIIVLEREASDVSKLCILCFHGALLTDLAPDLCSEEGRHSPTQMCLFSPGDDGWQGRRGAGNYLHVWSTYCHFFP